MQVEELPNCCRNLERLLDYRTRSRLNYLGSNKIWNYTSNIHTMPVQLPANSLAPPSAQTKFLTQKSCKKQLTTELCLFTEATYRSHRILTVLYQLKSRIEKMRWLVKSLREDNLFSTSLQASATYNLLLNSENLPPSSVPAAWVKAPVWTVWPPKSIQLVSCLAGTNQLSWRLIVINSIWRFKRKLPLVKRKEMLISTLIRSFLLQG